MRRSYQVNKAMKNGAATRPASTPGCAQPSGTPRLMATSRAPTPIASLMATGTKAAASAFLLRLVPARVAAQLQPHQPAQLAAVHVY